MNTTFHITGSSPSAAKRILIIALCLLISGIAYAADPVAVGSQVVLVRDGPMLLISTVVRQGKEGESFKVLKVDPAAKRVYVLSVGNDGKPAALHVPEDAVRLAALDIASTCSKISELSAARKYQEAQAATSAALLQSPENTRLKDLSASIEAASKASAGFAKAQQEAVAAAAKIKTLERNASITNRVNPLTGDASGRVRAANIMAQAKALDESTNATLADAKKSLVAAEAQVRNRLADLKASANFVGAVSSEGRAVTSGSPDKMARNTEPQRSPSKFGSVSGTPSEDMAAFATEPFEEPSVEVNSGPSFADTVEFILNKTVPSPFKTEIGVGKRSHMLIIREMRENNSLYSLKVVDPKLLSPDVKVFTSEIKKPWVKVSCTNGLAKVSLYWAITEVARRSADSIEIRCQDVSDAHQVAKAFSHLVEMLGGKSDLF